MQLKCKMYSMIMPKYSKINGNINISRILYLSSVNYQMLTIL